MEEIDIKSFRIDSTQFLNRFQSCADSRAPRDDFCMDLTEWLSKRERKNAGVSGQRYSANLPSAWQL